ncbi:hypothetical protein FNV43_RR03158 [Rhamnella rubrinervis]|uniref:Peptidase A1 domain-containing protein n=1 Tax=Rhamnella rubrinervis TaxID=2594499 RepID=A0A8K0HHX9_9ROSA|nr:hypothetical protein FNV43_RR03158 [Rhamnella rubrinervis]
MLRNRTPIFTRFRVVQLVNNYDMSETDTSRLRLSMVRILSSIDVAWTLSFACGTATASTTTRTTRLVAKLIHRDSVLHPRYNPNDTITCRAERAIRSSKVRLTYLLQQNLKGTTYSNSGIPNDRDVIWDPVVADEGHIFLANFSIGKPPVVQLAMIDTGSSLLWVQCIPCTNCLHPSTPIFDPSKSLTYANLSCKIFCKNLIDCECDQFDHVIFHMSYVDRTNINGTMATEQLVFETFDEGVVAVPNITFGCAHVIQTRYREGRSTGLMGLGTEFISLARQLGNRFSYCLGNISDPTYNYNHLVLGDGADLQGYSTPFETIDDHYYVTLEGISIAEKELQIDRRVFARTSDGGGVIIDSGSTFTFLAHDAFTLLANEVTNLMDGIVNRIKGNNIHPSDLCYNGVVTRDLVGFPVVSFHFVGGADLVLDPASLFYQRRKNTFCMAIWSDSILSSNYMISPTTVIGVMAQQNYNIAYDLEQKLIYFQRIDCELMTD